jgi:hypothetical protein
MPPKMRRNFPGAFVAADLGGGSWRLAPPERTAHPVEILLRAAGVPIGSGPLTELSIEWQGARALISMLAAGRVLSVEAASAIVHEPLGSLYEGLPLAQFDRKARTFWRRVFLLVRIPGGRRLLRLLAHLSRKRT